MARIDYYHDPDAPAANSLVVGSSVVVAGSDGRLLLQRRGDSGNWALPGGAMDIGETFAESVVREVKEETGVDVEITRIVGDRRLSDARIHPHSYTRLPRCATATGPALAILRATI